MKNKILMVQHDEKLIGFRFSQYEYDRDFNKVMDFMIKGQDCHFGIWFTEGNYLGGQIFDRLPDLKFCFEQFGIQVAAESVVS